MASRISVSANYNCSALECLAKASGSVVGRNVLDALDAFDAETSETLQLAVYRSVEVHHGINRLAVLQILGTLRSQEMRTKIGDEIVRKPSGSARFRDLFSGDHVPLVDWSLADPGSASAPGDGEQQQTR